MPDQRAVPVNLPNAVKWNPPLLSVRVHELEHPLPAFRKVDQPKRHAPNLGVEPVKVAQFEHALAELGIMPNAGKKFVDRGHGCPTGAGHTRAAMPFRQRILLGNCEPSLTAFLQALLGRKSPHAEFTVATSLSQLVQHATRTQFDAAIIVIDNVTVPTNAPAERVDAVLDALSQLQIRGAMPVTAMSVYCPNSEFIQRVRDAGADAFLLLPAEPYAIQGAVTAAFDNFVRRESSGLAPVHRLAAVLVDSGYSDIELNLSEDRNSIDFCVRRKPEDLGRDVKQHDREYSRMLGAIRAAGFVRVGFEELALEVRDDVVEGSFLVRPLHEVCEDSAEPADDDEEWLD
jgi:hypothetical protein